MSDVPFRAIVRSRLDAAGLSVSAGVLSKIATFLTLLAKWNARMNLTAFDLATPTDAAVDRLVVEPVHAAAFVRPTDRVMVDVGSGGGSPAFPFILAAERPLDAVLIEARAKRSAFLREVVRVLELSDVEVETSRLEPRWSRADLFGAVDIVTCRAVRADVDLVSSIGRLTKRGSRLIWFDDLVKSQSQAASFGEFTLTEATPRFAVLDRP